jgi:hypothetical protein
LKRLEIEGMSRSIEAAYQITPASCNTSSRPVMPAQKNALGLLLCSQKAEPDSSNKPGCWSDPVSLKITGVSFPWNFSCADCVTGRAQFGLRASQNTTSAYAQYKNNYVDLRCVVIVDRASLKVLENQGYVLADVPPRGSVAKIGGYAVLYIGTAR